MNIGHSENWSMKMQFGMHEAKSQLSRLGRLAWQGEEVVITHNGKPYLCLTPYKRSPRVPGLWKGEIRIASDFDETPQDVIDSFYESENDEELFGSMRRASDESEPDDIS